MTTNVHEKFMRRAIELARLAALEYRTGGVFGAVIVKDGKIVSEGMNRVVASHDPTWHAEIEAIRLAGVTLQSFKLSGCILYTSGEPCPMCLAACYWAGIEEVYYAGGYEDAKKYGNFDDAPVLEQLLLPKEKRKVRLVQILHQEVEEVWKKYHDMPGRVEY